MSTDRPTDWRTDGRCVPTSTEHAHCSRDASCRRRRCGRATARAPTVGGAKRAPAGAWTGDDGTTDGKELTTSGSFRVQSSVTLCTRRNCLQQYSQCGPKQSVISINSRFSVRSRISKPHVQTSPNILCMLPVVRGGSVLLWQ